MEYVQCGLRDAFTGGNGALLFTFLVHFGFSDFAFLAKISLFFLLFFFYLEVVLMMGEDSSVMEALQRK